MNDMKNPLNLIVEHHSHTTHTYVHVLVVMLYLHVGLHCYRTSIVYWNPVQDELG